MTEYVNPWAGLGERGIYATDAPGIAHAGCLIYHVKPQQWDVVKAGVCIAQLAGLERAKKCAEAVEDLMFPTYEDVRERMLQRHGRI